MGCHFLLQRIFLTQGLNLGLLHCRQIIYCQSNQGSPVGSTVTCKITLCHPYQIPRSVAQDLIHLEVSKPSWEATLLPLRTICNCLGQMNPVKRERFLHSLTRSQRAEHSSTGPRTRHAVCVSVSSVCCQNTTNSLRVLEVETSALRAPADAMDGEGLFPGCRQHLLTVSLLSRQESSGPLLSLINTLPLAGLHPHDLTTSQRPRSLMHQPNGG